VLKRNNQKARLLSPLLLDLTESGLLKGCISQGKPRNTDAGNNSGCRILSEQFLTAAPQKNQRELDAKDDTLQ